MVAIGYIQHKPLSKLLHAHRELCVGAGTISADLRMFAYTDPLHAVVTGLTVVECDFIDATNAGWTYSTVLHPIAFWPQPEDVVELVPEFPPTSDFGLLATLDDRASFHLDVLRDSPLTGFRKYLGISCRMLFQRNGMRMFIRMNCDDRRAQHGFVVFSYTMPYPRLMWRDAPLLPPGDIECESANYVYVRPIDKTHLGLSSSPIVVS